jgi:SagB-type dehydrogenase family enzyme
VKLTFRVQDGELWACDDEGRSRRLNDSRAAELVAWWEGSPSTRPSDGRTAAVLADLGQARMARPHPTGRTVSAQVEVEGERIPLGGLTTPESSLLADLLEHRHSSRTFGPTTVVQLATLLMRSGRVRDLTTVEDGYQASHRPAPSAGGRHPFDLHLAVSHRVEGLSPSMYIFDAVTGTLVAQSQADVDPEELLSRIGDHLGAPAAPAAAIFLVGYLDRTLSRYPAGMSLAWRDAGALLQTLHLCATDLHLRSCIAGTCGLLHHEGQGPVVDMGCLALGGSLR